jgi:hypothetical protein
MHYTAPQLRQSTANVLTDIGWFAAAYHVPQHQSLVDFLAGGVGVIKATLRGACRLAGYGEAADSPRARKIRVSLVKVGRITGASEWENQSV